MYNVHRKNKKMCSDLNSHRGLLRLNNYYINFFYPNNKNKKKKTRHGSHNTCTKMGKNIRSQILNLGFNISCFFP